MFSLQDLVQPDTLEDAYGILVSRKANTMLGGGTFLRLGSKRIGTAVDLSKLNLSYINEVEGSIEIGAMTTLRDLEVHPWLNQSFNGVVPKAISNIIGVQFRNVATIGASVFSKYGFSDLITALLVLDAQVELYKGGKIPLADFLIMPQTKDILTKVIINQAPRQASYQQLRNSASDFPILNTAVANCSGRWTIAVGARPFKAQIADQASRELSKGAPTRELIENVASMAADELSFGTNALASAHYRRAICKVLVQRGITEVIACELK